MKRWMAGVVTVLAAVGGLAASGPARASGGWDQTYQVNTPGSFASIAAISKSNIWAVGAVFDKKDNVIFRPLIRHYVGTGWKTVTIPRSPKF